MNPFALLPTQWLWPAVGVAFVGVAGFAGVQTLRLEHAQRDMAELQAAWAGDRQRAELQAREKEHDTAVAVKEATDAKDRELARARAAAAGARTELDGLRGAIAAADAASPAPSASGPSGGPDDAARARAVVGQCATALSQVAKAADACEARLSGLQGYVKAITGEAGKQRPED